jgi:hypothetical protein
MEEKLLKIMDESKRKVFENRKESLDACLKLFGIEMDEESKKSALFSASFNFLDEQGRKGWIFSPVLFVHYEDKGTQENKRHKENLCSGILNR